MTRRAHKGTHVRFKDDEIVDRGTILACLNVPIPAKPHLLRTSKPPIPPPSGESFLEFAGLFKAAMNDFERH